MLSRNRLSRKRNRRYPNRLDARKHRTGLLFERLENRHLLAAFSVTNAADSGAGSLRQAIIDANTLPGTDIIAIDIGTGGTQTITPHTPLPPLTDPVVIDGTTQAGYSGQPLIELDGTRAGGDGLHFAGSSSVVRGLVINNFEVGIRLAGEGSHVVQNNFIGTDVFGTTSEGNYFGIQINSDNNLIGTDGDGLDSEKVGNLISGNRGSGVFVASGGWNILAGNLIGTDRDGLAAIPNEVAGIKVQTPNNRIGTNGDSQSDQSEKNIISGNGIGIFITGTEAVGNTVAGNLIGTDITGSHALGNSGHGVLAINRAARNIIGTNGDGIGDHAERNIISGNLGFGIEIRDNASEITVAGNYVGTGSGGTQAVGNLRGGINIGYISRDNIVGTNSDGLSDEIEGNVISGNKGSGIVTSYSSGDVIAGNLIGLDKTGTTTLANEGFGVLVDRANSQRIGTDGNGVQDDVERNVISGSRWAGVGIFRGEANVVSGNYIGTDVNGTAALGNGSDGVFISQQSRHNVIGTNGDGNADDSEGNLISGNGSSGVAIHQAGTDGNLVSGNFIGTDITGSNALGNKYNGVWLENGPKNNVIGSNGDGIGDIAERNVISGNGSNGILFRGAETSDNVVAGNFIGTDASGTMPLGNLQGIVLSDGPKNNVIGTNGDGLADQTERNIISANTFNGIGMWGQSGTMTAENAVAGNFIGVDADGSNPLGNGHWGILLQNGSRSNRIGTNADGLGDDMERNVVSDNLFTGIEIRGGSVDNVVAGNYIGTDASGTRSLGKQNNGVTVRSADNLIGTNGDGAYDDSERNVIVAQAFAGIALFGVEATGNHIAGNHIGLDVTGILPLATTSLNGVFIGQGASSNVVGTRGDGIYDSSERNVISVIAGEDSGTGIRISGPQTTNNVVAGNYIGTDAAGRKAVGNRFGIVLTSGTNNNLIGTDNDGIGDSAETNTVSGNKRDGIRLNQGAHHNTIAGNYIGTNVSGVDAIGNGEIGIHVHGGAFANIIGGATGNTIAFSSGAGVAISDAESVGNLISKNSIHSNDGIGIDLQNDGVSLNDATDADSGGNSLQNWPLLQRVIQGASTHVAGVLESEPNTEYAIEFYANTNNDASDSMEGERYLASITVTTDGTGKSSFDVSLAAETIPTDSVTATATDPDGNTSEFSVVLKVSLSGKVFDDKNNDGIYGDNDIGLGGITIMLSGNDERGAVYRTASTSADGAYQFNDVRPGIYSISAEQNPSFLDGIEAIGNLGGTVINTEDSNSITDIFILNGDSDGTGYNFAEIRPAEVFGLIWQDFNNDGAVNFNEQAIEGGVVLLTGVDDRGSEVSLSAVSDVDGIYTVPLLRPSNFEGYKIREIQPSGFEDGKDTLGLVDGLGMGSSEKDDEFADIVLGPGSIGENYNFGERPTSDGKINAGQTATIGYWQNRNGRELIESLNGGPQSTQLGQWLASSFSNMYGPDAGENNLDGLTNAEIADYYSLLFRRNAKDTRHLDIGGPPKLESQMLAVAFATYVTNTTLAGTVAERYGFVVSTNGVGVAAFNIGGSGTAFDVANDTEITILDLLFATNSKSTNGVCYDLDGDGDANDELEVLLRRLANEVFTEINQLGSV